MKKLIIVFIGAAIFLLAGFGISKTLKKNVTSTHSNYSVVRYTKSVKGGVSDLSFDNGTGEGFVSLSLAFDLDDSVSVLTEADLLNVVANQGYELQNLGIASDKKSPYQYALFKKFILNN